MELLGGSFPTALRSCPELIVKSQECAAFQLTEPEGWGVFRHVVCHRKSLPAEVGQLCSDSKLAS